MFLSEESFTLDGRALNVAVGPANGPPLALFHGVCRKWQDMLPLVPALAPRWQLFLVDHRGHGLSPRAARYSVADYVNDAANLVASITKSAGAPVVLYGHSLGAMVAAGVAARLPDEVRGIALEDPPFNAMGRHIGQTALLEQFQAFHALRREFPSAPEAEQRRELVDSYAARLADLRVDGIRIGDVRDLASIRFSAACQLQMDPRVLDPIVERQWLAGYEPAEVAAAIRAPTLLFQADGIAGGMLTDVDADEFCRLAPRTIRVRTPGLGHQLHGIANELLLRHLIPFLESL